MTREHLTDEALNDVLIGMGSADAELHLAECPICRGKVEDFQSDVGAWNVAALNWSEARAERAGVMQLRPARRRPPLAALGWALAALALIAIAIPAGRESDLFGTHHATAVVAPQEDSEAQIAQDNELLKAVNAAINPDEMSPLKEYDLSGRPHPRHRRLPQ
jgi:predicted anti-sigma-YlaC factor YlaD